MIMVLIRYFGLAGLGIILLWVAAQQTDDAFKTLFRALALGCFVAWAVVVLYLIGANS